MVEAHAAAHFVISHTFGTARAHIFPSAAGLGAAAADEAAAVIGAAIASAGRARIIIATGNSQLELIAVLTRRVDLNWEAVEVFHMDEYLGLKASDPSSFRYWIRTHVENVSHPAQVHYLAGDADDLEGEIQRYSELLVRAPTDLALVGFGENGHIAFNDPGTADFADPAIVKRVTLDEACLRQQVSEGHFADLDSTPKQALTLTCPALFRAQAWICCVSDARKAKAVRNAFEGPISTACPASIVRTHPNASVYLDRAAAALLRTLPELGARM